MQFPTVLAKRISGLPAIPTPLLSGLFGATGKIVDLRRQPTAQMQQTFAP